MKKANESKEEIELTSEEIKADITKFYNDLLSEEFEKETDRGAVILVASLLDIQLESMLRMFLVPDTSRTDDLFEGAMAPLSNFSSKILMAYRLGLISNKFARDLNLIRRIRNEFAHNIHGCSFDHSSVKSRVYELAKSSDIIAKNPNVRADMPEGTRGDFLICVSWMLWSLTTETDYIVPLKECEEEFGYIVLEDIDEEDVDN